MARAKTAVVVSIALLPLAAVWCRGPKVEPCRPPQPFPNVPED